ncbi:MAG TPA: DNA polymerase III subunit delta, partial [Bacteroidia bacterium]|nr:DNA polymerase III subunit delta [Bacteroidia bacterium]
LGPEGNGALPLAIAYMQYLFCKQRTPTDSCGTCPQCIKISKLSHPDVHFVYPLSLSKDVEKSSDVFPKWKEAFLQNPYMSISDWMEFLEAENKQMVIGVGESKDILHQLSMTSYEGSYKVMIMWMAEKMNLVAANKILKILEEPPDRTIFILITENTQLPVTILSRTQVTKVPRITEQEMTAALISNYGLTEANALYVAQASEGNYRMAQILAGEKEESEFYSQKFQEWMRMCLKLNGEKLSEWIMEISGIGRERQKQFLSYSIKLIRQSLLMGTEFPIRARQSEEEFLTKFSPFIPLESGAQIAEELSRAYHAIERNANPKILLMSLSLKIHRLLSVKVTAY